MPGALPNIALVRTTALLSQCDHTAIALVEACITDAIEAGASDVHIDPVSDGLWVRLRIGGLLHEGIIFPEILRAECIARLKILAGLRTDEHAVPQDGRFIHRQGDDRIDVRICIMPTYGGENAVLRLLRPRPYSLRELGMPVQCSETIEAATHGSGLVLIVGATGSGKTTTLYAIVQMLVERGLSVGTIEDPIEYGMPGVRQVEAGRTRISFADGLRALLRQDPDALVIGEIRDEESARLAVQAALTGHLVISSMHAEDAAHAIPRLIDLGVAAPMLAASLRLVVAQELLRKPEGGRTGAFEYLTVTPEIAAAIRHDRV